MFTEKYQTFYFMGTVASFFLSLPLSFALLSSPLSLALPPFSLPLLPLLLVLFLMVLSCVEEQRVCEPRNHLHLFERDLFCLFVE